MHRLALANLTAIGLTPAEIIHLAADIGCEGVALNPGLADIDLGGPIYRIDNDSARRRETARALADTGVTIDLVDAFVVTPDFSLSLAKTVMDVFGELGARLFNVVLTDKDESRGHENMAALCAMAIPRGMTMAAEFSALGGPVSSLAVAVGLATSGKFPGLKVLIDSLHLARAGEAPEDIGKIDPALIGAAQICDGPAISPGLKEYYYEALFDRGIPGEGELPLRAFLDVIPQDVIVSPEVPLKTLRDQGVSIRECARRAVEGTRRLQAAVTA
jgi:sugar phosphate isomerase/epimerase